MKFIRSTLFVTFIFCFLSNLAFAERFWVTFKDKGSYQALSFGKRRTLVQSQLSERARQRRATRVTEPASSRILETDLPVDPSYLHALEEAGFKVHGISRWLNAVSGQGTSEILQKIETMPFVESVKKVKSWKFRKDRFEQGHPDRFAKQQVSDSINVEYGESGFQTQFHNINKLHEKGLNGEGVIVAMFDTGWRLDHPALEHVQSSLIAQYDFVQGDSTPANQAGDSPDQDFHGTATLSAMGGFLPGRLVGPAFGARFILAKTETISEEVHLEEDNWMLAAEWAEKLGADIVSSSLGYSIFDASEESYTYSDMDGETTIVTRAANELAKRGVLVISSAGNEGNSKWRHITAPADGYFVLAVGALDKFNDVTSFSSRGPTFDQRIKPDVSGLGSHVFAAKAGGEFGYYSGTSLSCPLVAGIAAQILQGFPDLNLLQLSDILKQSGDNSDTPDNDRGWGRVDALRAWTLANGRPKLNPTIVEAEPARPNPVYRNAGIVFLPVELPRPGTVVLSIYNILGQKIYQADFIGGQSQNLLNWDLKNFSGQTVAGGIYFYNIQTKTKNLAGKIIVLH